jgi:hypothetical protein
MARRRSPATAAIIVLVMASAIGNVGGTLLFWDIFGGPITEFLLCLAIGLMIAQPCSLAVWCALGTQNFVVRVPLTMGILFCLVCIYIGTIYAMENRIPMEIPIIFVVSSFALALLIQVPLWIFRLMTGYAISPLGTRKDSEEAFQFAIKHLMIATAIAAVVAAISKYAFGSGELDGNVPWGEIVGLMTTFALFVSMITLLCVAFVYSGASRVGIGILLGLVVTVGPVGVREVVSVVNGGSDPRMLTNIYGFTVSLTTALMVVLFAFHGMGYRLQRASD